MPVAYLTLPGLRASLSGERLDLNIPAQDSAEGSYAARPWIPLVDLERVVIDTSASLSSHSITHLLERNIPVVFMSHGNRPAGLALPFNHRHLDLALQLDASRDGDFRLRQARSLVCAKIKNMRRVIQRLSANRRQQALSIPWLTAMANQAEAAASIDSLRGLEGAATGRYFETIAAYFPEDLPFERRSRRPPHNEANALLSFLYTLLCAEWTLHLHACGLLPGWGVYHETEDNRPSLALDLMEPYRAPLCDALALDLLNHRRLKVDDFERIESGGILLRRPSRRIVFAAWEERLEREFHYEATNTRTTLRQLIINQCQDIKRAFRTGETFTPFLMN